MVNAKRMGAEIGRRFSATVEPASPAATHPITITGSAAPAPAAPSATGTVRQREKTSGSADIRTVSDTPSIRGTNTSTPLVGSRNPFEKTLEGGARPGKVEAATDLLARVRGQLERSEQRTKGLLGEGRGVSNIAPTR